MSVYGRVAAHGLASGTKTDVVEDDDWDTDPDYVVCGFGRGKIIVRLCLLSTPRPPPEILTFYLHSTRVIRIS